MDNRTAAATLVDILFGDEAVKDRLNIGLVPWNGKVNVGRDGAIFDPAATVTEAVPGFVNPETGAAQSEVYFANTSPVTLLAPPPPAWRGCVFNRFLDDGEAATDADTLFGPVSAAGADWPAWQPVGPEEPVLSPGPLRTASTRLDGEVQRRECTPCGQRRQSTARRSRIGRPPVDAFAGSGDAQVGVPDAVTVVVRERLAPRRTSVSVAVD